MQSIKKPTLLEICGPLFMSNPVITNLQYRLKESDGLTLITFRHQSFGLILEEYRNAKNGWNYLHEKVRQRAEAPRFDRGADELEVQRRDICAQHASPAQQ